MIRKGAAGTPKTTKKNSCTSRLLQWQQRHKKLYNSNMATLCPRNHIAFPVKGIFSPATKKISMGHGIKKKSGRHSSDFSRIRLGKKTCFPYCTTAAMDWDFHHLLYLNIGGNDGSPSILEANKAFGLLDFWCLVKTHGSHGTICIFTY